MILQKRKENQNSGVGRWFCPSFCVHFPATSMPKTLNLRTYSMGTSNFCLNLKNFRTQDSELIPSYLLPQSNPRSSAQPRYEGVTPPPPEGRGDPLPTRHQTENLVHATDVRTVQFSNPVQSEVYCQQKCPKITKTSWRPKIVQIFVVIFINCSP